MVEQLNQEPHEIYMSAHPWLTCRHCARRGTVRARFARPFSTAKCNRVHPSSITAATSALSSIRTCARSARLKMYRRPMLHYHPSTTPFRVTFPLSFHRPQGQSHRHHRSSVHHRIQVSVFRFRRRDRPPPAESNIIAAARGAMHGAQNPSHRSTATRPPGRPSQCLHSPQHPLVPQSRPELDMRLRRDPDATMGTPVPAARARADHAAQAPISSRAFRLSQAVEVVPALLHVAVFLFFTGLVDFPFSVDATIGPAFFGILCFFGGVYVLLTFLPNVRPNCPYTVG
jgi:hypothetical protein